MSFLIKWKEKEGEAAQHIMKLSQIYGSKVHAAIQDTLNNKIVNITSEMVSYHYANLFKYLKNIHMIRLIERSVYSKSLQIAGTADCIAEYKGELSVIDYKTKRKPQNKAYLEDALIQGTFYGIAHEEMTGEKIKKIVILVTVENGESQEFIVDSKDYEEKLLNRVKQYQSLN